MKRSRIVVTITLVFVLLAGILAGCSDSGKNAGQATEGSSAEPSAQAGDDLQEHMDITVSFWGIGAAFGKHDELLQKIEKDFNVTLKPMQIGWDDYVQKSQVWAASDQLPDIITHSTVNDYPATYSEWVNQGLIRALPDDLSAYPNVRKVAQLADVQSLFKDGKLHSLPRLTYPNNEMWALDRGLWVRKDWMDKLGLQDPKNFDEFAAMVKAFADNDPDGNNKDDTVGLVMNNLNFFTFAFMPTFPQIGNNSWVKEDGKWIPHYASKNMYDVVVQARKLFVEGGLDKDFAVMKDGDAKEKFAQGKAGIFAAGINMVGGPAGDTMKGNWSKYNPGKNFDDYVKPLHLWPSADGSVFRFATTSYWSESLFSANVDDKKMNRILRIYDFLLSPEGKTLFDYGIEGEDYKKEGDRIVITRPKDEKSGQYVNLREKYPSMDIIMHLAAWGQESIYDDNDANRANLGEATMNLYKSEMQWQMDNAKPIPSAWEIFTLSTPAKDKLSVIKFNDDFAKVILGKEDPVEMWQDIVKSYDSKGLQEAIQEVTDAMDKLGKS